MALTCEKPPPGDEPEHAYFDPNTGRDGGVAKADHYDGRGRPGPTMISTFPRRRSSAE